MLEGRRATDELRKIVDINRIGIHLGGPIRLILFVEPVKLAVLDAEVFESRRINRGHEDPEVLSVTSDLKLSESRQDSMDQGWGWQSPQTLPFLVKVTRKMEFN